MGAAGSISMTTGPREDARVKLEWSSSGARVELEWSSSGARVELEWSSSGARPLGPLARPAAALGAPKFGSSHTRILSTQCMRMYLQLVGCRPSCGCRDVSAPCAPIIMCCVVMCRVRPRPLPRVDQTDPYPNPGVLSMYVPLPRRPSRARGDLTAPRSVISKMNLPSSEHFSLARARKTEEWTSTSAPSHLS
jgi:hypothetical protein